MWGGMDLHELAHVECVGWTAKTVMVVSSREPFMAPSGHAPCKDLGGGGLMENDINLASLLQGESRSQVVPRKLEWVVGVRMSGRSPLSMEENSDGCSCSRSGGNSNSGMREDDDEGEQWFNKENVPTEW